MTFILRMHCELSDNTFSRYTGVQQAIPGSSNSFFTVFAHDGSTVWSLHACAGCMTLYISWVREVQMTKAIGCSLIRLCANRCANLYENPCVITHAVVSMLKIGTDGQTSLSESLRESLRAHLDGDVIIVYIVDYVKNGARWRKFNKTLL